MYFHNWLKRKGGSYGYVSNKDVINYVKGKKHPIAKQILKECLSSPKVEIIHRDVWEDEYYNFKSGDTLHG